MEEPERCRVGGDQGATWSPTTWAEGLTRYTGHWPKRGGAAPFQILDVNLFRELLLTPNIDGPEYGGVGKVMKLSFHPYKVLLKWTPYVAVALFLVQTVSGIREGNEVQVVDESDFNVYWLTTGLTMRG